jgi:hemerythrin-like domain-containing protein/rubredoxin
MMPIALLMIEHRQIERMIPVLREGAIRARIGVVDAGRIDNLVDFIRTYADRCHHGKEEDILFAAMQLKSLPSEIRSTMERLLEDHKASRENLRSVVDANRRYRLGETAALGNMASALERLANLYPDHIAVEDKAFFIPSMELFSKEEQARMLAQFHNFDRLLIHQIYRVKMDDLASEPPAFSIHTKPSLVPGARYACAVCDLIYDPAKGDPEHGIAPGTSFEDLPEDWVCPLCGASKTAYKRLAER